MNQVIVWSSVVWLSGKTEVRFWKSHLVWTSTHTEAWHLASGGDCVQSKKYAHGTCCVYNSVFLPENHNSLIQTPPPQSLATLQTSLSMPKFRSRDHHLGINTNETVYENQRLTRLKVTWNPHRFLAMFLHSKYTSVTFSLSGYVVLCLQDNTDTPDSVRFASVRSVGVEWTVPLSSGDGGESDS